ncbi:MAG: TOPRIM nucleotidyl transferase/hydrolase domain-containing protein [Streptosporangiales bacterium]
MAANTFHDHRDARAVVLVEGRSDRAALEALARRTGHDLAAEGVSIVSMGGATNIGHFLDAFGPRGLGLRLAGLCDAAEAPGFCRSLDRAGLGAGLTRGGMQQLGFFVCVSDLEDELIRALGLAAVEHVIEVQGDLGALRTFQNQPAQRAREPVAQLRRFLGTRSGRKIQYARLLAEALDTSRVPAPLEGVLAAVRQ